ncbi:MAG: CBS domain-containing protein [Acidobacteriota bacterium]
MTTVAEVMTSTVFSVEAGDVIFKVRDLMEEHRVRHIPVVNPDGTLIGLVSHRDLLRRARETEDGEISTFGESDLEQYRVELFMTRGVESVRPTTRIEAAGQIMLENKFGCLPVTEEGKLVGILTEADFVRLLASDQAT